MSQMTYEVHNMHGDGWQRCEVYHLPTHGTYWWESVTDVPCPIEGCAQTVVWFEAEYATGYRVCMMPRHDEASGLIVFDRATLRHRFLAGAALDDRLQQPTLIRDRCCETEDEVDAS